MLILSRKIGESIVIEGRAVLTVVKVTPTRVRLGFSECEKSMILRREVYNEIEKAREAEMLDQNIDRL